MSNGAKKGYVYLIGAGPGDPGLITVKGNLILGNCDAVIYDNLVPDELVATIPPEVEKHYVGKKAGKPCCSQDEINQLMIRLASTGKKVARLKGSDPLIFGRGGEEAKYLKENSIPYEIIPGVTSGIAAPAYCGIPCTDRNLASFVLFVTGHKAKEKKLSTVPWEWVAKAKGGTIVIYMGVGEIEKIVGQLTKNGMPAETPAAVIERGTFPTQKYVSSALQQLPETVREKNIKPPALFIIGEVVSLQPWLEWFRDKPLLGIRLMVTRAAAQAQELYENLRELGAEIQPYPTIGIKEHFEPSGWESFRDIQSENKWLIFTSETGVRHFMKQFSEQIGDIRKLNGFKIAAIGKGTSRDLKRYGLIADFIPKTSTAVDFGKEMTENITLHDATVVRVRGTLAGETIENSARKAGAEVLPMTVYETYYPKWPDGFTERLFEYLPDGIIFSSSSTVKGLSKNLTEEEVGRLTENADIFSIGPSTSKTLRKFNLNTTLEASPHNLTALTEQIVQYYQTKKTGRSK